MRNNKKYPIVLTADRTMISEYHGGIFLGFSACVPKGLIPDALYFSVFSPPLKANKDGSIDIAPYGSRKIEAALINYGFNPDDIVFAHPFHLKKVIGPETKVVGITETDPLGIGPATSFFTAIFGGEAYMAIKFRELINDAAIHKFKPKIIVGGPGAWQLANNHVMEDMGIDSVVVGEGEKVVGPLFEKAIQGKSLPKTVQGEATNVGDIIPVNGASVCGLVEIARGCSCGCDFCVPTLYKYRSIPEDLIFREIKVNLKQGQQPLLHAEDVLKYKAKGAAVNSQAVSDLIHAVRNFPGVNKVEFSHIGLSSVASSPKLLEEIKAILGLTDSHWASAQTGIETGSPNLMNSHMKGKCKPYSSEDWPHVVLEAFQILAENCWVPVATVILGLPGEIERDVNLTISLVEKLRPYKSLIIPLSFVAEGRLINESESFLQNHMTPKHTELFIKCWDHNLDWMEQLLVEWSDYKNMNWTIRKALSLITSIGIRKSRALIKISEKEYRYNIQEMYRDYRGPNKNTLSVWFDLLRLK